MDTKPLKRHQALQSLSREHHHGLLLCRKIREGFRHNIPAGRIKKYADWFWENHLMAHFETEEKYLFSVLPAGSSLVKKALAQHRRLRRLFAETRETSRALHQIEEELEEHIRFEERILFNEVQQLATPEQLQQIAAQRSSEFCDDWSDEFWKK